MRMLNRRSRKNGRLIVGLRRARPASAPATFDTTVTTFDSTQVKFDRG